MFVMRGAGEGSAADVTSSALSFKQRRVVPRHARTVLPSARRSSASTAATGGAPRLGRTPPRTAATACRPDVEWIQEYVQAGVNEVYCFNVGKNQRELIDVFGERVLPALLG